MANPTLIAFAPVNVAIGLIAGFLALRGWFRTYPKIVASGLIIMLTPVSNVIPHTDIGLRRRLQLAWP